VVQEKSRTAAEGGASLFSGLMNNSSNLACSLGLFFNLEDVCSTILRNVSDFLPEYTEDYILHSRGRETLKSHVNSMSETGTWGCGPTTGTGLCDWVACIQSWQCVCHQLSIPSLSIWSPLPAAKTAGTCCGYSPQRAVSRILLRVRLIAVAQTALWAATLQHRGTYSNTVCVCVSIT
jgi:hypothetical protein